MKKWLVSLAVLSLVFATAVVIVAFSFTGDESNTSGESFGKSFGQSLPADWQLVEASSGSSGFSIYLPAAWELIELQGIDSYVGEIVGEGVRLDFDFGWYSNPLANDDDPQHIVDYEDIGGRLAKLVRPRQGMEGYVGVYFENFDGGDIDPPQNRLQISGRGLTLGQEQTAFEIVRSIRWLTPIEDAGTVEQPGDPEPSGEQRPIRSDECNWVHNIAACEGKPTHGDPTCEDWVRDRDHRLPGTLLEDCYDSNSPDGQVLQPAEEDAPPGAAVTGMIAPHLRLTFERLEYNGIEILGSASPNGPIVCCGTPINLDDMEVVGTATWHHFDGDETVQVYRPKVGGTTDVYTFHPAETLDVEGEADETDTTSATWTRWTTSSPEPAIFFPQGQLEDGDTGGRVVMEALNFGKLVEVEGCLRVTHSNGVTSHLLIWPPNFTLSIESNELKVVNAAGQVVARVGDDLRISGGAVAEYTGLPSPDQCPGPYWIVGDEICTAQATDESDANPDTN